MTAKEFLESKNVWTGGYVEEDNTSNNQHSLSDLLEEYAQSKWVIYDWKDVGSRPPKPGRYLIYRSKCNKMHFERWNGSGWASSNNDCTHWQLPEPPKNQSKQ